jgi:hypothetical protein
MPDRFGFDYLGASATVRCIDCASGGPIWRWPEENRQHHAASHGRNERLTDSQPRRHEILAAPPSNIATGEEKEASTMARTTTTKGEPAKQVVIEVLRNAGTPLHAKQIAERVLASGRTALKGKTPEATISALLAVGSKPGGPFTRVGKGTYTLAETTGPATAEAVPAPKPAATKRASSGKSPAGRKSAARTETKRAAAKRTR